MNKRFSLRVALAALVLVASVAVASRKIGPVPALGPLLDPVDGVWNIAKAATRAPGALVHIPNLKGKVDVVYDDRGVPHIFATNEDDAYRVLGYVVARDRLFQMDLQTRATKGTLSELAGARLVSVDSSSRALGLARAAEAKFAALDKNSPSYRAVVAYSDGVNAWIEALKPRDYPMEYRLLSGKPVKWEPINTVYFMMRMNLTLGYNDASLARMRAQALVGRAAADAILPVNSPIQEPIQPNGLNAPRFDFARIPAPGPGDTSLVALASARSADIDALLTMGVVRPGVDGIGSNNWAVAPARTRDKHAILAGDPHLDLSLPSVWYEAHIVVPGVLDVAGVTFPGVPGIVIGFNRDAAWTFTNGQSDVNDYYAETVDDLKRPRKYMLDGAWKPITLRAEQYRDASGAVIMTDTLLFTHRGPMRKFRDRWLSMRWTALEPSDELEGFIAATHAHTATEWLTAMERMRAPIQNGLVADRSGNIAIRATGAYPVRPGNRGDLIFDGRSSGSDWTGFIPLGKQPGAVNPAQGFLASANQQPIDPKQSSDYLGSDWYPPWRAMRINQLLRADSAWTPEKIRSMQTDAGSARVDAFLPVILRVANAENARHPDDKLSEALRVLSAWDRHYSRNSTQAVLFEQTMSELQRRTWDELLDPKSKDSSFVTSPADAILLELMSDSSNAWWDDRRTAAREDEATIV
ncbi:MAG: penicillin acylase family protein, partial [Gemmatimonadaceae bacterium]|nr:penicillin acylase family protein [Gemmatimonadaceae bacterium]